MKKANNVSKHKFLPSLVITSYFCNQAAVQEVEEEAAVAAAMAAATAAASAAATAAA